MRTPIHFPKVEGISSRQAHCDFPAEGFFEREIGRSGFFGPATMMHHAHPPTAWTSFEGPLRPRAFRTNDVVSNGPSPWDAPLALGNAHCKVRLWTCDAPMPDLARNADGDDLLFVHAGAGELFCDYGRLEISEGDYVLLPRNTMWRLVPSSPLRLLMTEATGEAYGLPDRGILGQHAFFDPACLRAPQIDAAFKAQQGEIPTRVLVKRRDGISTIGYPFNPLDAVGWHGDLSVVALNWRDLRPVMSARYHLPPSVHSTFVAPRFVICTFAPRPIETDPGALKVPFFHSNDDYDEVLFYHSGDFFSRDNIVPGMLSLHPAGFAHGPHPKALKKSWENPAKQTDEVAVMIDTRDPLEVGDALAAAEWPGYVDSWKGYHDPAMKIEKH